MDRKWWTLIAVCIGTFMLLIDVTIVNVALPDIQTSLKASFSDLQWIVDAYALMLAALLLTSGSLADLFGRRRVFAIGLCIFTLSSLLSGLATTPLFLNLARGAQGVGGAAMFSTSLALLASSFRGHERGTAFGVWGAITGLAVAIGPVVGGALTSGLSWRWIFLVNVPIGVIGLIVTLLRVQESRQPGARRPDWLGALAFSGALAALVYALIQGESRGWTSREIVGCLAGAGVLLLVFLIVELIQKAPMFDLSLFRNPTFAGGSIVAFALSAGMFALLLYLTLYIQNVLGFSALDTGLRLLFLSGGILLTSTLAGRLTTRVPIRLLIGPGLILVGVGLILMRGLTAASGWEHLIPGFIVGGAGVGLINPPLASTAVGVVEPARAGMASGINSTFRQVGIATGIAGLGAIFSHSVRIKMTSLLAVSGGIPLPQAHAIAADVAQGSGVGAAILSAPPAARQVVVQAVRQSFVGGLNQIFLIGAILSFGAALLSMVLIRNKDFEASAAYRAVSGPAAGGPAPAAPAEGDIGPALAAPAEGATGLAPAAPAERDTGPIPAAPADGDSGGDAGPIPAALAEEGATGPAEPDLNTGPVGGTGPGGSDEPAGATAAGAAADLAAATAPAGTTEPARPTQAPDVRDPARTADPPGGIDPPGKAATAPPTEVIDVEPAAAVAPPVAPSARNGSPAPNWTTAPSSADPATAGPPATNGPPAPDSPAADLADRSYVVALAADQAHADCSGYVERLLARLNEARRATSTPDDGDLRQWADQAGALLARLHQLDEERHRLATALRDGIQAAGDHTRAAQEQTALAARSAERVADTRRELYALIAALATLTDEARVGTTTPEPAATRDGQGTTPGAPLTG
ncbi:MAG: hypothetical protein QOH12_2350 [Solirubrobacteraceae bacterium]|jgi:EmrB/QacA subfamily drug resistance transporter|nr:hypothetical protein [Solirubrobacteraceae bacterium]